MSVLYISDTHFGHENIMKHCNRPFSSVKEMDDFMIQNWNNNVKPKDDVYILGDFCFKTGNDPKYYLDRLNGHMHIILGNHDKPLKHITHPKIVSIKMYDEIKDNGKKVILFHYPITEWDAFFRDSIHLYGHIHNSINDTYHIMKTIKNAYNVGADILDFAPRTLEDVILYNKRFQEKNK